MTINPNPFAKTIATRARNVKFQTEWDPYRVAQSEQSQSVADPPRNR